MAAPQILTKEYGPFTGTVWLVVIVGGVGLGLVLRRFMGGRDSGDSAAEGIAPGPDYGVATGSPAFPGGGTMFNQGEIVSSVIEAINAQKPPAATTDPTVTDGTNSEGKVTTMPVGKPVKLEPKPKPKPKPAGTFKHITDPKHRLAWAVPQSVWDSGRAAPGTYPVSDAYYNANK